MAVRLNFSSNSVRNTTVSNNGPGIYYAVSTTSGITSVMRWDRWANVNVLVGQFELSMFGSPRVRLGFYDEWRLMGDFLYIGVRGLWSNALSFKANNGTAYRWKTRNGDLIMTQDSARQPPLVTYRRHRGSQMPSYLEVSDLSLLGWFDKIILSFLIYEARRRRSQRAAAAGAAASLAGATAAVVAF